MKTAISLPDALFDEAEKVSARLGISRSELYSRALEEHLRKFRASEIRESYDRAYAEPASDDEAALRRAAARRRLAETEW